MKKRYNHMLLTIGLVGLIVCFALGNIFMYHQMMVFQQNVIGALYNVSI